MLSDLDTRYINRVRLGGVKFWLDGSLDTAWFNQPYTVTASGKTSPFSGYRQIPDEVLDAAFDKYWPTELQIHMHMNGDAAADQALRAVTAMAAYQLKEENSKGTLEVGKLADLVILEHNPLKVESTSIKDIRVVETIKEGRTVFKKP